MFLPCLRELITRNLDLKSPWVLHLEFFLLVDQNLRQLQFENYETSWPSYVGSGQIISLKRHIVYLSFVRSQNLGNPNTFQDSIYTRLHEIFR